jgi:hypothetical protein
MHALMNLNPQLYYLNPAQYIEPWLQAKFLVKQKGTPSQTHGVKTPIQESYAEASL